MEEIRKLCETLYINKSPGHVSEGTIKRERRVEMIYDNYRGIAVTGSMSRINDYILKNVLRKNINS